MPRSLSRLLFGGAAILALAGTALLLHAPSGWFDTSLHDRIGRECKPMKLEGMRVKIDCLDQSSALMCVQDGHLAAVPCRGPGGCSVEKTGSFLTKSCDVSLVEEGDPCVSPDSYFPTACGLDHRTELQCVSGHWKMVTECLGAGGCTVSGNSVHCDSSLARVGGKCQARRWQRLSEQPLNVWHDTYACSEDGGALLICKENRYRVAQACRERCQVRGETLGCTSTN
jgi:hypothetical protein